MIPTRVICSALASGLLATFAHAEGIPEPGLVMYGAVRNTYGGANIRQTFGTLQWTFPKATGGSVVVTAALTNFNDQFCYVARVPFETVPSGFAPSANALQVSNVVVTYSRTARVDGTIATLVAPSTANFTFGPADRGRMERVDLTVSYSLPDTDGDGMPDAYETHYFGNASRNGLGDFDGDGMKDRDEYRAGTNPSDARSLFEFIGVAKDSQGGMTITWSSQPEKQYTIERSTDLLTGYAPILSNIMATSVTTSIQDVTATNQGAFFYRVRTQ